jgi:hypothetical protein
VWAFKQPNDDHDLGNLNKHHPWSRGKEKKREHGHPKEREGIKRTN